VRELGRRLDLPVQFLSYDSAAAMADDARTGDWDVAFLAADPAREETISFTPPYLELDATYLVPAGSRFQALDEIDADGVRVAARPRSAYDLFLRRSLTRATLVYPEGEETDLDVLKKGRADVMAGLTHVLNDSATEDSSLRVLDGRFAAMQQAIGVPRGRDVAVAYLRGFIEEVKASGLVARAIEATGAKGVSVAP
jgi:polar amino acid transport system substrate-binding protein